MTSPSPGGTGAGQCMRRALAHAKLAPEQVDYVNAHATSTSAGDVAENSGIKAALIDRTGRKNIDLAVSSTKGAIGHLLGAAGAVESIFTILALHHVSQWRVFTRQHHTYSCNSREYCHQH